MAESLVKCPMCGGRRELIWIKGIKGGDVRRFRCEVCITDSDYAVTKNGAQLLDSPERPNASG
jgi:transposase-like protein